MSGHNLKMAVVTLVLILGAVACLAVWGLLYNQGAPDSYAETDGTVINVRRQGCNQQTSGSCDLDTDIRFTASDGVTYEFSSKHGASQGDSVTVSYDPADPGQSAETAADRRVNNSVWFILAMFLGLGGFLNVMIMRGRYRDREVAPSSRGTGGGRRRQPE